MESSASRPVSRYISINFLIYKSESNHNRFFVTLNLDLNLDGLSDVMFSYMDYSTHALTTCGAYLNQGNGSWEFSYSYHTDYDISIAMSALWQGDVHDNTITEATRGEFIDVNGDDFIDLVYSVVDYSSQHLTFERIYINNSTGFEYTSDWSLPDALYAIGLILLVCCCCCCLLLLLFLLLFCCCCCCCYCYCCYYYYY